VKYLKKLITEAVVDALIEYGLKTGQLRKVGSRHISLSVQGDTQQIAKHIGEALNADYKRGVVKP
jgi:flavodoxin